MRTFDKKKMNLNIESLKTDRQWRSSIGMPANKFWKLLGFFSLTYEEIHGENIEERTSKSPNSPSITTYQELLFFTLFSLKAGLSYDLLGFVSGMDGSNAKRNQTLGLTILKQTLINLSLLPKQKIDSVEEFKAYFAAEKNLILDATEQAVQRPKNKEEQADMYSGKKKDIL